MLHSTIVVQYQLQISCQQRTLEREIRGCQVLIIWTDCDREGENIGFEVIETCRSGECCIWNIVFRVYKANAVEQGNQMFISLSSLPLINDK